MLTTSPPVADEQSEVIHDEALQRLMAVRGRLLDAMDAEVLARGRVRVQLDRIALDLRVLTSARLASTCDPQR